MNLSPFLLSLLCEWICICANCKLTMCTSINTTLVATWSTYQRSWERERARHSQVKTCIHIHFLCQVAPLYTCALASPCCLMFYFCKITANACEVSCNFHRWCEFNSATREGGKGERRKRQWETAMSERQEKMQVTAYIYAIASFCVSFTCVVNGQRNWYICSMICLNLMDSTSERVREAHEEKERERCTVFTALRRRVEERHDAVHASIGCKRKRASETN